MKVFVSQVLIKELKGCLSVAKVCLRNSSSAVVFSTVFLAKDPKF